MAPGVVTTITGGGSSYFVYQTSATSTIFTIERLTTGYSRSCTQPGTGGCQSDSSW